MTSRRSLKSAVAIPLVTLALGAVLAGCGEDQPAVCGSIDSLSSSVDSVKAIDVTSSGGISDLKSGLKAVGDDLSDVKADAKSEYSTEIDAVETSYASLRTSVESAVADPSAATLTAARTALSAFGTDVQSLITDVKSTC